ncbi:MAG: glycosyl hydrolase [Bacteroidetes bacterium]|nr:glycosyl hydrolase [Bacteroidota bacterium]MBK8487398.1 glycosyl hydrolase [Bacteroidota bacterium]MBK8682859.1 glycosyl hydrolase [Bacteroidota bacterium]
MKKLLGLISIAFPLLVFGQSTITDATFSVKEGRQIGPAVMSGRIAAIDAVDSDPNIVYVGAAGGGVWKSKNQGTTFKAVFDDYSQSIGAICIDQSKPETVWVGTGEPWVRNSVSIGTGVYRTTNGGEKWELMGLEKSERIAQIAVHPKNSDIIYVAALGALWAESEDRGLYRSMDAGKTWTKILYTNASSGCTEIVFDPQNPEVLYTALWDFRRTAYDLRSGGPGSGLYRSEDGGNTWNKIQNGLPNETLGRIAISASPVAPYYVYALVESDKSALYRSTDKGNNWVRVSNQLEMGSRPFYFSKIVADPIDSARVYKPGFYTLSSNNAGATFSSVSVEGGGYHPDHHALYISPIDNRLMYVGTDGGVYVSVDRGNTWRHCQNLPVSQFYHVSLDNAVPYNVYGGLQDNGSWTGPSSKLGGIKNSDWKTLGYGDGFNCFADRDDPNVTYWQYQGGRIYRSNSATGESKYIKPFPDAETDDLRFNWNAPVVWSKKKNNLYVGSQYLYRSKNKGDSWERISPDLSTNDPNRQKQEESGGLTPDNSTAENNTTIFSIAESPLDENIIWVGTDDGNVQLTKDGGKTWTLLNPKITGLPKLAFISGIDADNFDKASAYITVDAHRNGDMSAYVFATHDFGQTWQNIATDDIKGYCHVIKQDLQKANMFFLGTELGLFISIDNGANWTRYKSNIPPVAVYDMAIHPRDNDLVLATHGRGIIIIDDLTPIRGLSTEVLESEFSFVPNRPYVFPKDGIMQDFSGDQEFVGKSASSAAQISYFMSKRHVFGDMYLEVYDSDGNLLKKLPASGRKGLNIVSIDTRMKAPKVPLSINPLGEAIFGPDRPAGTYTIKVIKEDQTYETQLDLNDNPVLNYSDADKKARMDGLMKAYNMLEELAFIDKQVTELRDQSIILADSVKSKGMRGLCFEINQLTTTMHEQTVSTQQGEGGIVGQVRLREKIGEVYGAILGYSGKPGEPQLNALELYNTQVKTMGELLDPIKNDQMKDLNAFCVKQGLTPITLTTREEFFKEE